MNRYYIMNSGKQEGPFTAEEIRNKRLDPSTYVLLIGTSNWNKISDVNDIFSEKESNPPIDPHQVINSESIRHKKKMFTNPFSFYGRIRRTEYGISFIVYFLFATILNLIIETGGDETALLIIFIFPLLWFLWAQGAKRCHDLNNSGWYQLIPFYVLWLLFESGDPNNNAYGESPK